MRLGTGRPPSWNNSVSNPPTLTRLRCIYVPGHPAVPLVPLPGPFTASWTLDDLADLTGSCEINFQAAIEAMPGKKFFWPPHIGAARALLPDSPMFVMTSSNWILIQFLPTWIFNELYWLIKKSVESIGDSGRSGECLVGRTEHSHGWKIS